MNLVSFVNGYTHRGSNCRGSNWHFSFAIAIPFIGVQLFKKRNFFGANSFLLVYISFGGVWLSRESNRKTKKLFPLDKMTEKYDSISIHLKCHSFFNLGHLKPLIFHGTNGKLMVLGVPIFMRIRVVSQYLGQLQSNFSNSL